MRPEYEEWIQQYEDRVGLAVLGACKDAVEEMKTAFPELTVCRGHVFTCWGKRGHWWLKDETGVVVDPTVSQYPVLPVDYEEWLPGDEVRVGKCMNCGEDIWREIQSLDDCPTVNFCSDACDTEMCASLSPS